METKYPDSLLLKPEGNVYVGFGKYDGCTVSIAVVVRSSFETGPHSRLLFSTYNKKTKEEKCYVVPLFENQFEDGTKYFGGRTNDHWVTMYLPKEDGSTRIVFKKMNRASTPSEIDDEDTPF